MATTSPSSSPPPPKQRLIRARPFYQRWMQAPEDWSLRFLSGIEAQDWDALQNAISYPIVVGLNALMISVNLGYWFDDPMSNVPTILRNTSSSPAGSYHTRPLIPGFSTLLTYLKSILVAISILNTLWFASGRRNYRMLQRSLHERPPTANVRMVEIEQDASHWSTRFPGRLLYPFYVVLFRRRPVRSQTIKVWEMSVWNPSILSRNIFCGFSPAQVLIMAAMDDSNFYLFAPLALFVATQVYFLTSTYQAYLKDKQILFSEVYREYNQRFVHPRLFVQKFDKQVSAGSTCMTDLDDDEDGEEEMAEEEEEEDYGSKVTGTKHRRSRAPPSYWPKVRRSQNEVEDEDDEDDEGEEREEDDILDEVDEEEEDEDEELELEEEDEEDQGEYEAPKTPHPTNSLAFSDDEDQ
ncbi:hypothetical protein DFQ27_007705 [Actinomortierella ambigua]|uniref:Nuclear rim protein 1 n=1 Tax=Actinomortierella ambigua TaxID=1343610 RepID=A0A9P6TZC7_9FUNG|nr:hypothetical protein DFQ27_007705 [Actinomortierella ambigua]